MSINSQMDVYGRFKEEMDALTIKADDPAAHVVGVMTRAVKRAQMVQDGELIPVADRERYGRVRDGFRDLLDALDENWAAEGFNQIRAIHPAILAARTILGKS